LLITVEEPAPGEIFKDTKDGRKWRKTKKGAREKTGVPAREKGSYRRKTQRKGDGGIERRDDEGRSVQGGRGKFKKPGRRKKVGNSHSFRSLQKTDRGGKGRGVFLSRVSSGLWGALGGEV